MEMALSIAISRPSHAAQGKMNENEWSFGLEVLKQIQTASNSCSIACFIQFFGLALRSFRDYSICSSLPKPISSSLRKKIQS